MKAAGYSDFGEEVGGHRALFMDVNIASTLGMNLLPVKTAKEMMLKLGDPRVVKTIDGSKKFSLSLCGLALLLQERDL